MNVFNRIFVVLVLLAIAVAAVAIIVLAWSAPNDSIRSLRDAVDWLDDNNDSLGKSFLTAAGVLVAFVCLVLLGLELAPRYGPDVKVTDVNAGDAVLSRASIAQRVEEGVREVPHVDDVKASIKTRRNGVDVFLELHVDPDANLAQVTDGACEAARDILTQRVHVALAHPPRARLHYRELRINPSAPAAAAPTEAPTEAPAQMPTEETPAPETTTGEPGQPEEENKTENPRE